MDEPTKPKNSQEKASSGCCLGCFLSIFAVLFLCVVAFILYMFVYIRNELPELEQQIALIEYDEQTGMKAVGWAVPRTNQGFELTVGIMSPDGMVQLAPDQWRLRIELDADARFGTATYDREDHDLGYLELESADSGIFTFASNYIFTQNTTLEYTFWFEDVAEPTKGLRVYLDIRQEDGSFYPQLVHLLD